MKKWFLHILLLAGLFGVLTTSCSQEEDDPTQESRKAQVVFTLALDGQSSGSRGTWEEYSPSDIGEGIDNRINPDQFHVQIIAGGKTYTVSNILTLPKGDNVYEFMGEVSIEASATDARIMVYANMNTPSTSTFVTSYTSTNPYGVQYIPMWGVQTVSLSLTPGTRTTLNEPIYLLRAMAKVEINLKAEGYTLEGVTLNRYNSTGYNLPADAAVAVVVNTKKLHYDNENPLSFNPCTTTTGEDLNFRVSNNHLVFYLPEVANGTGENGDLTMTLTIKDNETNNPFKLTNGADPVLYFKDYQTNTPFDVVRNHWYKYTVSIYNKAEFNVSYKAEDWVDIEPGTLNFGDEDGATLIPNNSNQ